MASQQLLVESEDATVSKGDLSSTTSTLMEAVHAFNKSDFATMIDEGADPTKAYERGSNICHMLAKKNLTEWADICIKNMSTDEIKAFVNNGRGKSFIILKSDSIKNIFLIISTNIFLF